MKPVIILLLLIMLMSANIDGHFPFLAASHYCLLFKIIVSFLADRTNGRAYATVLRLSIHRPSVCDVMYCG